VTPISGEWTVVKKILLMEHVAEYCVFQVLSDLSKNPSQKIAAHIKNGTDFKRRELDFREISQKLGIKGQTLEVKLSLPIREYFELGPVKFSKNKLALDHVHCLDCAIVSSTLVAAIEVKSGVSRPYKDINSTLTRSRDKKFLRESNCGTKLKGDVINIIHESYYLHPLGAKKFSPSWMLVLNNPGQIGTISSVNGEIAENLSLVLTMEDVMGYIKNNKSVKNQIFSKIQSDWEDFTKLPFPLKTENSDKKAA
jgi:hypothetical protein